VEEMDGYRRLGACSITSSEQMTSGHEKGLYEKLRKLGSLIERQ
jgi:hypothetical protein